MYIRIEEKIKRRIGQKIVLLVLLAVGIGVLLGTSFKYCDLAEKIFSVLLSVAIYIFLFFKIKLIPLLRDKAWTGTVDSRACKRVVKIIGFPRPYTAELMTAYWKIHKDDGQTVILPYVSEDDSHLPERSIVVADDYFKTGDRVRHFKGAQVIVLAEPEEDNDNLLCPLCGKMVMKPKCSFCKIDFSMPSPKDTDSFLDSV